MDDHGQLEYATASGNDYPNHEQMYRTFVTLTKSFVAVIAVIVILMAIFLTELRTRLFEQLGRRSTARLTLVIDVGELLATATDTRVKPAHDERDCSDLNGIGSRAG